MSISKRAIAAILALAALRKREEIQGTLNQRLDLNQTTRARIPIQARQSNMGVPSYSQPETGVVVRDVEPKDTCSPYKLPAQTDPDSESKTILHIWYPGYKAQKEIVDPITGAKSLEEVFIRTGTPEMAMLQLGIRVPYVGSRQEKNKILADNGIQIGHVALEHISRNSKAEQEIRYLSVGPGPKETQYAENTVVPAKGLLSGRVSEMESWKPNESKDISEIVDRGLVAKLIDAHNEGNDPDTLVHRKKSYFTPGTYMASSIAVNCASAAMEVLLVAGMSELLPSIELAKIKAKPYFDPNDVDRIVKIAESNAVPLKTDQKKLANSLKSNSL